LIAVSIVLSIVLSLAVLWMVVAELTRFYFHANHFDDVGADGVRREVFTPRFTLTALRMPTDELSERSELAYRAASANQANVRLLVAGNDHARRRIDRQVNAYPGVLDPTITDPDGARAAALFALAASHRRSLVEEVAKVEYGMVRHVVRLQVIVLRYVKALLLIIATTVAAFVCAASVTGDVQASIADQRWIAATMMIWAPTVAVVVGAPVRWLDRLLRSEGAAHSAVRNDSELTQVEDLTNRVTGFVWAAATAAMVMLQVHHPATTAGRVVTIVLTVTTTAAMLDGSLLWSFGGLYDL
jgi:hypothetical protein